MPCERCIYKNYRKIPPTPIRHAEIAIVGEAPGKQELVQGIPFVGESGEVLARTLARVGLPTKEEMYVTNVLLCRPPEGQIRRQPIVQCRPRLIRELEEVQPKIIVALGSTALQAISGDFSAKITKHHAVPFPCPFINGTLVMPLYHPAKLFRTPGDFPAFLDGFRYVADIYHGKALKDPGTTTYKVVESESEVPGVIDALKCCTVVGADIETAGRNPLTDRTLDLGIAYEKNRVLIFPRHLIPYLLPLFESKKPLMCWHNGQFDTSFLRRIGIPARIDHDTILLHYCLNEHEGDHDLDTLSRRDLGAPEYKSRIKKYVKKGDKGYESVPKDKLYPYLAKDCDYTFQLYYRFAPLVGNDPDLRKLYYDLLLPHSRFLRRVQRNGLYLNMSYIKVLREELQTKSDELTDKIVDMLQLHWDAELYKKQTGAKTAGLTFLPTSNKQLAWMLFDCLRLVHRVRRKKALCVDKHVLESMRNLHPAIPKLLELRTTNKMKSTYVDGMLKRKDSDGRIRSSFLLFGTKTGRLSSRNPNLQNIPRDSNIKAIFCAPPGRKLIEADYKGAELRVLAYLSDDDFLKGVFKEGRDLHDEVARFLFGENFTKEQRVKAKNVNFGIAYGRTAYTISQEYDVPLIEAQAMLEEWFSRAPGARKYLLQCDADAENGVVLTTPFGRKRRFGLISKENIKDLRNEARNFRIQSIASDLTLISARNMESQIKKIGNATVVNLVHDNIVVEVDDDTTKIREVMKIMKEVMEEVPKETLKTDVPFGVDFKVGTVWGKLKKTEW